MHDYHILSHRQVSSFAARFSLFLCRFFSYCNYFITRGYSFMWLQLTFAILLVRKGPRGIAAIVLILMPCTRPRDRGCGCAAAAVAGPHRERSLGGRGGGIRSWAVIFHRARPICVTVGPGLGPRWEQPVGPAIERGVGQMENPVHPAPRVEGGDPSWLAQCS